MVLGDKIGTPQIILDKIAETYPEDGINAMSEAEIHAIVEQLYYMQEKRKLIRFTE
jgi:hypothetical protein